MAKLFLRAVFGTRKNVGMLWRYRAKRTYAVDNDRQNQHYYCLARYFPKRKHQNISRDSARRDNNRRYLSELFTFSVNQLFISVHNGYPFIFAVKPRRLLLQQVKTFIFVQ